MASLSSWVCTNGRISDRIFSSVSRSYDRTIGVYHHVLYLEVKNCSEGDENRLDNCQLRSDRSNNAWSYSYNRTIACSISNSAPRAWPIALFNGVDNRSLF